MASVDDVLDAFHGDIEPEISLPNPPPANDEKTLPPPEEGGDRCLLAVKAAMETIDEFCGMEGIPVTLAGITVRVPTGVWRIAQMKGEIPREDRIETIGVSTWMRDLSKGLCTELRGLTAGTPEHKKCAVALGKLMTEELVK